MEITPEMRIAICAADGHWLNLASALPEGDTGTVAAPDPAKLPHISCRRCPTVWLIVEDSGVGYADALAKFKGKLKNPDDARPRPRQ